MFNKFNDFTYADEPIPVAEQSRAWVYGPLIAGIAGSKPAGGLKVCLCWVLCVVR